MKYQGKKSSGTHTTIIEGVDIFTDFAEKSPLVTKVSIGIITPIKSRNFQKRIKILEEQACLCLKIRMNRSIQEIRLFSQDLIQLKNEINEHALRNSFEVQ